VEERVHASPVDAFRSCCAALHQWVNVAENQFYDARAVRSFWWRAFGLHAECVPFSAADAQLLVQQIDRMHPVYLKAVVTALCSLGDRIDVRAVPHHVKIFLKIMATVSLSRSAARKAPFLKTMAALFASDMAHFESPRSMPVDPQQSEHRHPLESLLVDVS